MCLSFCLLLFAVRAADLTPESRYELAKKEFASATTDRVRTELLHQADAVE